MSERETLIEALKKIAKEHWELKKQPILLSNLPSILITAIPQYKDILTRESLNLKKFISDTEGLASDGYKLVTHPSQVAKLGLVPMPDGADFQFENEGFQPKQEKYATPGSVPPNYNSSQEPLVNFLFALKRLPPEDLADIKIPVSVLVKMLNK